MSNPIISKPETVSHMEQEEEIELPTAQQQQNYLLMKKLYTWIACITLLKLQKI